MSPFTLHLRPPFSSLLVAAASFCAAMGCGNDDRQQGSPDEGTDSPPGDGDGDTSSGGAPHLEQPLAYRDAEELFGAAQVPVFSVTMSEDNWAFLNADPTLEEYVQGQLVFDGTEVGPVGLRYKGSYGSLQGCLDDAGQLDGCNKLSLKMKFSEFDADQRFYGLKRLNFHGMARDASKLHDKISYKIYREAGIPAPRTTWARLEVNGQSLGLFALVEQIDGRFTDHRFPQGGDGNLYKEVWPRSEWPETYVDHLKTNEETADVTTYVDFREQLYAVANPVDALSVLESWMDVDQLYTYIAIDDTIGNWDGITAFYCGEYGCGNHNFYMYQHEDEERFTLVPWDMDSTLSASTPFDQVPHWTESTDCDARYPVFDADVEVMAPGCDAVFAALAAERQRYAAAIDEVLSGPFDVVQIRSDIDDYVAFISAEIAADPTLDGVQAWMNEVESLKAELDLLKERAEAYRDGREIVPLTLQPETTVDFEDATALQFLMANEFWVSPGSTATLALHQATPLSGVQDARLDFVYRDRGDEPWAQWIGWWMALEPDATDLSAYSGIRFTLATDQQRDVRLDLQSPHQPGSDDGAVFGWDVVASQEPASVELLFSDLAIPVWATSAGEQLDEVLSEVTRFRVTPVAIRGTDGFIGEGLEDPGHLQIDDIEIF